MPENKQPSSPKNTDKQQSESFIKDSKPAMKNRVPEPWESQPCPLCRAIKSAKRCPGHGGGGGGGGTSGESASKDSGAALGSTSGKATDTTAQTTNVITESALKDVNLRLELTEKPFNPEIISDLLSKRLLLIDNDRELGTLTIKLLCNPKDLSPEQRNEFKKFVDTILKELEEFKKENGISNNCKLLEQDKEGNILSLRIALPTPTLYDAFIQRLANKNLLPLQNIEQKAKEKVTYQEGINHFNPTPLSTKPTPENKKITEEEIQKTGEKKSSIRPKSPLDGLKPKGWE
ncbi:MAG: hypothetical protein KIT56_08600 [Gammaproteobacteria bacterium]|nr:hypothetical protein [Gammaproteobacteria bacterium]MCW5583917.1 hypothetical protein [Gammaproteobacteria bacterium]